MLFKAVIVIANIAGLVAASPVATTTCAPQLICVDAINDCGKWYGSCYDLCSPELAPTPPPCTPTTPTPGTPFPIPTFS
ncbi:hypothetical protein F66182_5216 [Fusarium sp. NRRL 66182]|nr:hypothetical protein F66182_5216 [Fusarium sp. NRRL 66182]